MVQAWSGSLWGCRCCHCAETDFCSCLCGEQEQHCVHGDTAALRSLCAGRAAWGVLYLVTHHGLCFPGFLD